MEDKYYNFATKDDFYKLQSEIRESKYATYKEINEHIENSRKSHFKDWMFLVCLIVILIYGFLFLGLEIASLNKKIKAQKSELRSITKAPPSAGTNAQYPVSHY